MKKNLYEIIIFLIANILFFATLISFLRIVIFVAVMFFVMDFIITIFRDTTFGIVVRKNDDLDEEDNEKIDWIKFLKKGKLIVLGMIPIIYILFGELFSKVDYLWYKMDFCMSWKGWIIIFIFGSSVLLFWIKKQIYMRQLSLENRKESCIKRRILIVLLAIVYLCAFLALNVAGDFAVKEKRATIIEDDSGSYAGFFYAHKVVDENGYIESVSIPYIGLQVENLIGQDIYVKYGDGLFGIPYSGIYGGKVK